MDWISPGGVKYRAAYAANEEWSISWAIFNKQSEVISPSEQDICCRLKNCCSMVKVEMKVLMGNPGSGARMA